MILQNFIVQLSRSRVQDYPPVYLKKKKDQQKINQKNPNQTTPGIFKIMYVT